MTDITMPQLGETVTEGTITRWLKSVGERVEEDEVLFEVSTDKVDSEVPSPVAGVLSEILVAEGETVDVGVKLAVIGDADSAPAPAPAEAGNQAAAAPVAPTPAPPPAQAADAPAQAADAPAQAADAPAQAARGGPDGAGLVLSPVVRKLISEHQLDPTAILGSGTGGRITRADVLAAVDVNAGTNGGGKAATAPGAPPPPAAPVPAGPAPATGTATPAPPVVAGSSAPPVVAGSSAPPVVGTERDEVVAFSNIRRRTAEHMVRSKATSAHTLVAIEVDYENIEKLRRVAKEAFRAEEGFGLSYLPFVAMATAQALRAYPRLNASVGDDALVVHKDLHLGIAVDLDLEGLIVPVVHNADGKRLRALAREVADLAGRARSRKLTADDITGGTFTITNPGPFGTYITVPIINQPQVGILSTDGVKRRPVVVEMSDGTEGIAIHSTGILALSFDHRAVDGAYASAFLVKLKEELETRDWEQEL
ncbi:MAG: dihydrolipoamide acetyltransferase family protein [Acidimicrobiales bacterium]